MANVVELSDDSDWAGAVAVVINVYVPGDMPGVVVTPIKLMFIPGRHVVS